MRVFSMSESFKDLGRTLFYQNDGCSIPSQTYCGDIFAKYNTFFVCFFLTFVFYREYDNSCYWAPMSSLTRISGVLASIYHLCEHNIRFQNESSLVCTQKTKSVSLILYFIYFILY